MILNNVSLRTIVSAAGYEFDRATMSATDGDGFDAHTVSIVVLPADRYLTSGVAGIHCRPTCREEIFVALQRAFTWQFDTLFVYVLVNHGSPTTRAEKRQPNASFNSATSRMQREDAERLRA